jgi:hypothetical protein
MRKTLFSGFAVAALFSAAAVAQPAGTAAERTSFDLTPAALKQMLGLQKRPEIMQLFGAI